MIIISKTQFEQLEDAKLIDHTRANKNYCITSHKKKAKRHKYYVVESRKILNFLSNN